MLTSERQRLIREEAIKNGEVSIADMAKKFSVSIETIRRDINIMCEKNLIKKVHGGAIPMQFPIREDAYDIRCSRHKSEKLSICDYIARNMVNDNESIAMSSGSTMEMLADMMTGRNLIIVTNSINVASILQSRIRQNAISGEVIILGGEIHPEERYTSGAITVEMLKKFTFSKAFFSASAVSGRDLMVSNMDEGIVISTMIKHSQFSCAAVDSSKFDLRSTYTYADLAEVDAIVTEGSAELSEDMANNFKITNIDWHKATIL
ncbi:MAG: DeoR/GlpR transcriptional regulator [Clostridia bacterium]|nr:DeoR/GlpR transcriptional regulator [Clostridia bacterium]